MSLVEVMLATTVAGSACLAGLAGLLMSLRTADSNRLALQAATNVRAVAEQLASVDYNSLFLASLPVDVPSRPGGSLTVDTWNSRTDDFHHTPNNAQDDLQLRIRPTVTRITETTGADYALVALNYEWSDSSFFGTRTRSDSFTVLLASMSTY